MKEPLDSDEWRSHGKKRKGGMKRFGVECDIPGLCRRAPYTVTNWYETERQRDEALVAFERGRGTYGFLGKNFRKVER